MFPKEGRGGGDKKDERKIKCPLFEVCSGHLVPGSEVEHHRSHDAHLFSDRTIRFFVGPWPVVAASKA